MSKKVRVAIAGVGNCASVLFQGTSYYHSYHSYHSSNDHKKGNENDVDNNNNNNNNDNNNNHNHSQERPHMRHDYCICPVSDLYERGLVLVVMEPDNPQLRMKRKRASCPQCRGTYFTVVTAKELLSPPEHKHR